jgi:hypothetical protein
MSQTPLEKLKMAQAKLQIVAESQQEMLSVQNWLIDTLKGTTLGQLREAQERLKDTQLKLQAALLEYEKFELCIGCKQKASITGSKCQRCQGILCHGCMQAVGANGEYPRAHDLICLSCFKKSPFKIKSKH